MPPSYWTDHRIIVDLDSHAGMATALAVSLTAGIIVTGSHDRTVKVWDLQSGVPRRTIRLPSGDKNLGKIEGISLTPDGEICAVSGRITGIRSEELIYLLDPHTGKVIQTICGVSNSSSAIGFSPDGRLLLNISGPDGRVQFYRENSGAWEEMADRTRTLGGVCSNLSFDRTGCVLTTSQNPASQSGRLHVLGPDSPYISAQIRGVPLTVACHPKEDLVAIGYYEAPRIEIWNWRSFEHLWSADVSNLSDRRHLGRVAWSADGELLFAVGMYGEESDAPFFRWTDKGRGQSTRIPAAKSTIKAIAPLSDGSVVVLTADPWLARYEPNLTRHWSLEQGKIDFRLCRGGLHISDSAEVVEFPLDNGRRRFDLRSLELTAATGGLREPIFL